MAIPAPKVTSNDPAPEAENRGDRLEIGPFDLPYDKAIYRLVAVVSLALVGVLLCVVGSAFMVAGRGLVGPYRIALFDVLSVLLGVFCLAFALRLWLMRL